MLALGIPVDFDDAGNTIVNLNIGGNLKVKNFPQDSEFQLLAFNPSSEISEVVWIDELAKDIAEALTALEKTGLKHDKSEWYRRLALYCSGTTR